MFEYTGGGRKRLIRVVLSLCAAVGAVFAVASQGAAMTPELFYQNAREVQGINAFAATCQSAHETGFWTSALWKSANNGAGIKADKVWRSKGRPSVRRTSREEVGGKIVRRVSYFRSYESLGEFLADYKIKIAQNYPYSVKHSDTVWGYFSGLQRGRYGSWATTQRYFEHMADKAFRLAPRLLGLEWRAELLKDYREARSRGLLTEKEIAIVEKKLIKAGVSPK